METLGCGTLSSEFGMQFSTKVWYQYLSGCQISDLSPLAKLKNLSSLSLNDNKFSDLAGLSKMKKLERLNLDRNPNISDLSPLAKLKNLSSLSLSSSDNITKSQIAELKKALPKCGVYHDAKR